MRLFVIGALMAGLCLSDHLDIADIQVDLVFPRNGSVYRPVYPFPIAFALHNLSTIWSYKPQLTWDLHRIKSDKEIMQAGGRDKTLSWESVDSASLGANASYSLGPWGPPTATTLGINSTRAILKYAKQQPTTTWVLRYDFIIGTPRWHCEELGFFHGGGPNDDIWSIYYRGYIKFTVDNQTGIMPDLKDGNNCSVALGAIGYGGINSSSVNKCPLMEMPPPKPKQCAFPIDGEVAEKVSQAMVEQSECKSLKWPSFTSDCPQRNSAVTGVELNVYLLFAAALTALFSLA